ncbi:hypothetical protein XENOCAPTIV_004219 [Xenoophorus captivus]|uniref:Uncharacterized protein n=1 Tax=Xenoophorus captivus TaxID=1517983 RepID=A0ABV0RXI8_9TELE
MAGNERRLCVVDPYVEQDHVAAQSDEESTAQYRESLRHQSPVNSILILLTKCCPEIESNHRWICLFSLTSVLGGTKAEVRCIPRCQLPLVAAVPPEGTAPDQADFDAAPGEEFDGFGVESFSASGEEKHVAAVLTVSEESSFKVQPLLGENKTSGPQRDGDHQKLSHPPLSASSASGSFPNNASEESDNRFNLTGGRDAFSWRVRRGAETWSGFRSEDVEDASVSDQEEFQLTSSTFALTGDTAHNQAMVHWSGQNSSVSIAYFVALHILRTAVF